MGLKFYTFDSSAVIFILLAVKILTDFQLLTFKLLTHILYSCLILQNDVFIWLQKHAQIEFFPKLIIKVPHNGSFDA